MLLRFIFFSVILVTAKCSSTPLLASTRNVQLIHRVLQMTNESSADPKVAVNLMFVHFTVALSNGNLTEIEEFFAFPEDRDVLFWPVFTGLDAALGLVDSMSFSVKNCYDSMSHNVNSTTCHVAIGWPWQDRKTPKRIKLVEVIKNPEKPHNLYSNGYSIVGIDVEARARRMKEFEEQLRRKREKWAEFEDEEVVEEGKGEEEDEDNEGGSEGESGEEEEEEEEEEEDIHLVSYF